MRPSKMYPKYTPGDELVVLTLVAVGREFLQLGDMVTPLNESDPINAGFLIEHKGMQQWMPKHYAAKKQELIDLDVSQSVFEDISNSHVDFFPIQLNEDGSYPKVIVFHYGEDYIVRDTSSILKNVPGIKSGWIIAKLVQRL